MKRYVIRRNEDDKFVAPPGHEHSYTTKLEKAQTFPSFEAATAACCGNERAVLIDSLLEG